MEGSCLPKLMWNIPRLERVDIRPADILAPGNEFSEENRDVPRFDGHKLVRSLGISNLPSAFVNQPIDERSNRVGHRRLNRRLGDILFSIRIWNRQRNHARLVEFSNSTLEWNVCRL